MRHFFLLLAILGTTSITVCAQLNLAGIVTDQKESPLAGATLVVKGTAIGTTTQKDGRFTLPVSADLPLTLVVSFIGHQRREVPVRGNNFRNIIVKLTEETLAAPELVTAVSRVPEDVRKAAVTVEKLGTDQFHQSPALSPFDALQYVKGVDLVTQSLANRSVNTRGFGSTTPNRFLQLTDGMDNRSPGLGFGFGHVAGLPDLDVETIELVPGASSALYGPDAMQGLLITSSKNPFTHQGLSAQVKAGVNNFGKGNFGPRPYSDMAVRYAGQLGDRLAFKVNFQQIRATDFIADNYNDRSTRTRSDFFSVNPNLSNVAIGIRYRPNNNANTNFQYDGVNSYGDEVSGNGSAFTFPADYANVLLQNKQVTRTGYTELDLLGNRGKVLDTRANVALHYKLPGNVEASVGWYYGNGNFIQTNEVRAYFPDYRRSQLKAELRGDDFFLRAYTTQQKAEAWNMGPVAPMINNRWKSLGQWIAEFGQAYVENKVTVGESRATADRGRYLPGSAPFDAVRDVFANTFNTDSVPGYRGARGARFRDNSALWHYEGMYNLTSLIQVADVIVGGSYRRYVLNTGGTLFPLKPDGTEYTIDEYGGYLQASKEINIGRSLTVKPSGTLRYDRNQYLKGVVTPRVSTVVSIGQQHLRSSWQTAFHNPTPGQLFAVPETGRAGEVGGLNEAAQTANLFSNPAYQEQDVLDYSTGRITDTQLQSRVYTPVALGVEKMKTWEIGYKTLIKNKLSLDAYYFQSQYTNTISARNFYQPATNQIADLDSGAYRVLRINTNSRNVVFVKGWGVGGELNLKRGFVVGGNYAYQVGLITLYDAQGNTLTDKAGVPVVKRKMSNPEVVQQGRNYFNSPENRYSVSLSNPYLTDKVGFAIAFRWTDRMWYEQGFTAGDVWLPAWSSLDAQASYKVSKYNAIIKFGSTNLLNKYYSQGYGLARIGGLYYVSVTFDEWMK